MHTKNNKNDISLREALGPILRVLKDLKGEFTFMDEEGDTFIISCRKNETPAEMQLSLEGVSEAVETFMDDGGQGHQQEPDQDIPFSEEDEGQYEEINSPFQEDDMSVGSEEDYAPPSPPPIRVRFEPLKGDLPPELQ